MPSSFDPDIYADEAEWKRAVGLSNVRLQWDPDHSPSGGALRRRAIQLGLRGGVLEDYAHDAILDIQDISNFVAGQRENATRERLNQLVVPLERIYIPSVPEVATRLKLSTSGYSDK